MGFFVFAVLLLFVSAAMYIVHIASAVNLRTYALIPLGFATLLLFAACIKTVGAREVGIPETFGSLGMDLQPGVHLVAPWTNVHICSSALQQTIMSSNASEGDKVGNDAVPVSGKDNGSATANVSLNYSIDRFRSRAVYRAYACNNETLKENFIRQRVRSAVSVAATQFGTADLRAHKLEVGKGATDILRPVFQAAGLNLDNVVVSDVILSPQAQQAADAKLSAEQAAQQAQFALQKAQIDAQTQKVNADAEAAANTARQVTLTPAILCQQWIDMLKEAKPQTLLVSGPCGASAATAGTILQIPAGKSP